MGNVRHDGEGDGKAVAPTCVVSSGGVAMVVQGTQSSVLRVLADAKRRGEAEAFVTVARADGARTPGAVVSLDLGQRWDVREEGERGEG